MQKVVRTYPKDSRSDFDMVGRLNSYLKKGWKVVMCHPFIVSAWDGSVYGNEYVIEKEDEDVADE